MTSRAQPAPGTRRRRVSKLRSAALALLIACSGAASAAEPRFAVSAFRIEGDLPIARETALAIVSRYTGESVAIEDLQSAASALEAELTSRGYAFYRVIVPPQDLAGTVTLRVLPFRLASFYSIKS